jgi:NNP family nitrate/nitrite transporter-like MFS transporter
MHFSILGANTALTAATFAFAINFSVWTLFAALGIDLKESLQLSETQLGLLFSSPVLTGAISCIIAGTWSERLKPKSLLIIQMLLTAPALFLLPLMETFNHYLLLGLWIGLGGASFTIGLRYVVDWFDRHSQGTAMGIFGIGDIGAALTLIVTPLIIRQWGWQSVGPIFGIALIITALLFWFFAPTKTFNSNCESHNLSILSVLRNIQIWRFGLYYYFVFGSFLALILWLPHYYVSAYKLSPSSAMAFTITFIVTSSMARALGGWFSDRYGGRSVNWMVFWICIVCLFFLSYPPTTMTIHGVKQDVDISIEINVWIFSLLIFIIGIAQGFGRASIFKTIHEYYPQNMGQVGGFVAGIGSLGGCTLPILFGLSVDLLGIHSASFMTLYGVLACCMAAMFFANKSARLKERVIEAKLHNFLDYD